MFREDAREESWPSYSLGAASRRLPPTVREPKVHSRECTPCIAVPAALSKVHRRLGGGLFTVVVVRTRKQRKALPAKVDRNGGERMPSFCFARVFRYDTCWCLGRPCYEREKVLYCAFHQPKAWVNMVKSPPVQNWHGGSRLGNRSARLDPTCCPGMRQLGRMPLSLIHI